MFHPKSYKTDFKLKGPFEPNLDQKRPFERNLDQIAKKALLNLTWIKLQKRPFCS